MLRFQQLDREFILQQELPIVEQKTLTQNKIISFVQEGIGALLAYLPVDVALHTMKDFLSILQPQADEPEEVKQPPPKPKPAPPKRDPPLIENTSRIDMPEINGQIDYMQNIGYDAFLVGSTVG